MTPPARTMLTMIATLVSATATLRDARAAGGHFDVDDATILDTGHCQTETWWARTPAAHETLIHLGPSCRAGPLEVGLNVDRLADAGDHPLVAGPQVKWAVDPLIAKLSIAIAWSASFDLAHGGRPWQVVCVPVTWWAAERLWLHANVGADRAPSGASTRRLGLSGEWAVNDRWSVIAERTTFTHEWTSRAGARINLNASLSVDLSEARVGAPSARTYAVGLNYDFVR